MATQESDDTQLAITDDANTAVVVPEDEGADIAELAWSVEQAETPPDDIEPPWRGTLRWAALVTLVGTTAAATVWLATVFYHERHSPTAARAVPQVAAPVPQSPAAPPPKVVPPAALPSPGPPATHENPPAPKAQPEPSPSVASPAPPTVASAPPLPDPPAHAYDTYIQLLARDGIVATNSPEEMYDQAYWICRARSTGDRAAMNRLIAKSEAQSPMLSPAQIRAMLADAIDAYCPEYR